MYKNPKEMKMIRIKTKLIKRISRFGVSAFPAIVDSDTRRVNYILEKGIESFKKECVRSQTG